jgi:hypothetical protein
VLAGLVLFIASWTLWRWWKQRPPVPGIPARTRALEALERLRAQVTSLDPYAFSIAVPHVLRDFVERQYHIPALEQTSPEFLATIAERPTFTRGDRALLADFLERCDGIKFGRVGEDPEVNGALLGSAVSFVNGGAP